MMIEPQHFSFVKPSRYALFVEGYDENKEYDMCGVQITIGGVDGHEYRRMTDKFPFTVSGSNKAYESLLFDFWRYIGAV